MKYTFSKSNSLMYVKMIGKDLQIQFITKKNVVQRFHLKNRRFKRNFWFFILDSFDFRPEKLYFSICIICPFVASEIV